MVPAPRIRVTDGELPKGPGGGIRAYWDVQLVGPPSNLISCTGARLMEPSRAESGETARQIQGTAPALRRATRSHRTAPAGGAPLPGSWETREQTTMPPEHHRTCAGSPTLSHEEGDDARAGRGRRGGWRTRHERRHLVPGAQEAERIGVPAADHVARPAGAAALIRAMSPLKSWLVEKPSAVDAEPLSCRRRVLARDRRPRTARGADRQSRESTRSQSRRDGEPPTSGNADERAAKSTDAGAQQLCLPPSPSAHLKPCRLRSRCASLCSPLWPTKTSSALTCPPPSTASRMA